MTIVVRFTGGLGNQLFEYARYLQLKKEFPNATVKADLYDYTGPRAYRKYQLQSLFNISVRKASVLDIVLSAGRVPSRGYSRKWKLIEIATKPLRVLSKGNYIRCALGDRCVLEQGKDYYVWGEWEDESYFLDVKDDIHEIFQFRIEKKKYFADWDRYETVGIHIRKGDYIGSVFDILSEQYYKNAMDLIERKVTDPYYIVSSDDNEYAKSLMIRNNKKFYIIPESENDYVGMALMSQCRHNIIANSTYSWWSAYLNKFDNKIVIGPNRYKSGSSYVLSHPSWIQIDAV